MLLENENIIFLHPGKTGGTSVEYSLINKFTNYLRYRPLGQYAKICNYDIMYGWSKKHKIYLQHADIRFYKSLNFRLSDYTVITSVRRPYERVLSAYYYNGWTNKMDFNDFVQNKLETAVMQNKDKAVNHFCPLHFYIQNGAYVVNYLIRLEHIEEDCKSINLNLVKNHHAKTKASDEFQDYMSAYTPKSKGIVYGLYKEDFKLLGYKK